MSQRALKAVRNKIDQADDKILRALAQRRKLTDRVLRAKGGRPSLRDVRREEQIYERVTRAGRLLGLDAHLVSRVFHEIIDDSIRTQRLQLLERSQHGRRDTIRVAFQGIAGAYSQMAAYKFFARDLEKTVLAGCESFDDVVRAVERGTADYAILPIENTTAGSINQVYDLLTHTSLSIIGEEVLRVDHCLLATTTVPVHKIRRVLSHPQALAQCAKFLAKLHDCQTEFFADTAMAVRKVREDRDPTQAAIASEDAGRRYGLKVIQRDLSDTRENFTRFIVVSKEALRLEPGTPSKTSIVLTALHKEGSLLQALDVLHRHKINMTKLESRPRPGTPFEYLFYIDFEGDPSAKRVSDALKELKTQKMRLKVLGSYPVRERSTPAKAGK